MVNGFSKSLLSYFPDLYKEFFTIGYEGKDINSFIQILKKNKIKLLIDVREIPLSRKKGFSKNQLNYYVNKEGIKYLHIKELGTPSKIRHKFYINRNFEYFSREYKKCIKNNMEYLKQLITYIQNKKSCIMCFEKDFNFCHRKIISQEIKKTFPILEVKHLN